MIGVGQLAVELQRGPPAVVANPCASVAKLVTRQRQAAPAADRRMDGFDLSQAAGAQPGAQAPAGHAIRWKEQIKNCGFELFEPRLSRWSRLNQTCLCYHSLQALRSG